jgi:hypothetical protein
MHPVILPPPLGVHNGHVPGSQGAPRGSGAPHGPPRRSATLTQMEPVRALTWGGTVRGAKTHPVTVASSARTWWACWGHPSSRWPPKGSPQVTQGWHPVGMLGHRPDVRAPTFGGALRGAETHPVTASTLGARVVAVLRPLVRWWPPRGGGIQRKVQIEPFVVRAEGPTRVRGGLSSGGQASNLYQGGWNTISAFFGATPNLSLQCSMPAGHVPSRAVRLTLRRTRIHSSHLWRL